MSRVWYNLDTISKDLSNLNVKPIQEPQIDQEKLEKAIAHKNKLIDFDRTRQRLKAELN